MNDWMDAEQRVERAHELYESGRWEEAVRELRAALRVNPHQPEWQYNLGVTLEAMGRYADAVEAFKRALGDEGEDLELLNILGINCTRADRTGEALQYLHRAEQLDPADPTSYVNRIETYTHMGDHEQARTMFYQALHVARDEPARAYLNVAVSLMDTGEVDRALWCLQQVQRLEPGEDQLYARLGDAWWAKGDHEKAYAAYIQHLRRHPGDGETLLDLGNLLIEMQRPAEAAEKFRRAIELDPASADAHFCLGQLALMTDHAEAAQRSFELALQIDPKRPEANQRLAWLALREGKTDAARVRLKAELEIEHAPRSAASAEELARLLLDAGMPAQAAEILEPLVAESPDQPHLTHQLAVSLLLSGRTEAGMRCCRRAVKLDDKLTLAMHNLTLANLQLGNLRRAIYWLKRARRVDKRDRRLIDLRRKLRVIVVRQNLSALLGRLSLRRPR